MSGPGARRPVKDTTHPDCLLTRGVTLFNHGYYWEAHEAWERLWQAMPRDSAATRLLQDLIVLAAARVKARQGQAIGIAHNAARAAAFFASRPGPAAAEFDRTALVDLAAEIRATPPRPAAGPKPEIVLPRPRPHPVESQP